MCEVREKESKAALYAKLARNQQSEQLRLEIKMRYMRDSMDMESTSNVIYEESCRVKAVTEIQKELRAQIRDLQASLKYDKKEKDEKGLIQGWLEGIEKKSRKAIREAEEKLTRDHAQLRSLEEKISELHHYVSSINGRRARCLQEQLEEEREDEKTAEIIEHRETEETTEEGIMK